jgi:hypothetical protein
MNYWELKLDGWESCTNQVCHVRKVKAIQSIYLVRKRKMLFISDKRFSRRQFIYEEI